MAASACVRIEREGTKLGAEAGEVERVVEENEFFMVIVQEENAESA